MRAAVRSRGGAGAGVTWFKVDDGFHSHPKVLGCSLAAVGLWARAGSWCSDHEGTRGEIPKAVLLMFGAKPKLARELVDAGLWDETETGWRFHDWDIYQPSAEELEEKRRKNAEKQQRWRERNPEHNRLRQERRNQVSNPPPVPSRPDPVSSDNKSHPSSAAAASSRREDFGGSRVVKLPAQTPDYERAAAAAGWLSRATGQEAYSTNPSSKHYAALLDIAGKPEAQKAEAARVLKLEGGKPNGVRYLTPQHVVDNWRFYANGEAPGRRQAQPTAAVTSPVAATELEKLNAKLGELERAERACLYDEDDKKQRIKNRKQEIYAQIERMSTEVANG